MSKVWSELSRHFATTRMYAAHIGWFNAIRFRALDLAIRSGLVPLPASINLSLSNSAFPLKMRTGGSSDRLVLYQVFVEEEYSSLELADPEAILDLGANVGYSSAYFLSKYPTSRVVAVEPDPQNYLLCCRNLRAFGDRATVVHGAVWPERTGLVLVRGKFRDGNDWATQVRPVNQAKGEASDVEGYDVATLMGMAGAIDIDLVKVDIEGSERELFASNTHKWLPHARNLAVELHGDDCEAAFWQALSGYSYDRSGSGELTLCQKLRPMSKSNASVLEAES
jgi:FkbM family methyltransferase